MRKLLVLLLLVCVFGSARAEMRTIVEGLQPVDWDQDTLCLPPAYFPEMPEQLRAWLEAREYRIPQVHDFFIEQYTDGFRKQERYNLISGNLDGNQNADWVFVTFRNDSLKAYISWDADTSRIVQLDISEFGQKGYYFLNYLDMNVYSFLIVTALVKSEWLNVYQDFPLQPMYGDTTTLPTVFTHDGIVFDSSGDMWDGGFIRYFDENRWIRFSHSEAGLKAVFDSVIIQKILNGY